jgi:GcrA cell cycle regulator
MTDNNSLSLKFPSPDENSTARSADTTALPVCPSPAQHQSSEPEEELRTKARRKVVTTATLSHRTCRWPFGDPVDPDFHYCGKSPQSGSPYCEVHDRLSYQTVSRRK